MGKSRNQEPTSTAFQTRHTIDETQNCIKNQHSKPSQNHIHLPYPRNIQPHINTRYTTDQRTTAETHLNSSLTPYAITTSGNSATTAFAAAFMSSSARRSFGFANPCFAENLYSSDQTHTRRQRASNGAHHAMPHARTSSNCKIK